MQTEKFEVREVIANGMGAGATVVANGDSDADVFAVRTVVATSHECSGFTVAVVAVERDRSRVNVLRITRDVDTGAFTVEHSHGGKWWLIPSDL